MANQPDDTRDQLLWRWTRGELTDVHDFKDPVNGNASYRLCLYDGSSGPQPLLEADIPAGGTCGTKPCWKPTGTTGFSYKNKLATPDGVTMLKLKAGATGKAKVLAKGKGVTLHMPPFGLRLPVTMQLVIGDETAAECWQTTYTSAIVNDLFRFTAQSP